MTYFEYNFSGVNELIEVRCWLNDTLGVASYREMNWMGKLVIELNDADNAMLFFLTWPNHLTMIKSEICQ